MLYSVIDIGSNTVKLAVLDEENLFSHLPVFFKAVPLNLRSKVENKRLSESATEDLCCLLKNYLETSARLTSTKPIVFATASLRGLENTREILAAVREKVGVEIEVLSGETEAYFSFLGARGSFPVKGGITVDLGGGSTEILSFRKNCVLQSVSLPFGCLTLYNTYFADGKFEYEACCKHIREHLKTSAPLLPKGNILLSGGSAKAVLKYKNVLENKKCHTVGSAQFRRIKRHFLSGPKSEREKIEALLRDRYRLIPVAVAVFSQIADFYEKDQVFVCRHGVREGCLSHYLKKQEKN